MYKNNKLLSDGPLVILVIILALLVNSNQIQSWSSATDRFLYDQLISFIQTDAEDDVMIIEIDDQSLSLIGDWPWDRAYHAELIDILTLADAQFVAYNLTFSSSHLPLTASDYLLADSILRSGRVILPIYFDQILNNGPLEEILPHSIFTEGAQLGHVNVYLDDDGVYRSVRLIDHYQQHDWPHFSLAAYEVAHNAMAPLTEELAYIRFVNRGTDFKRYSFVDVITGEVDLAEFYQKKVFVGVTATSIGDPLITSVSQNGMQMAAVDINANIYQMLNQQQSITVLPLWLSMLINTLAVALMVFLVPRLSMVRQVLISLFAVALVTIVFWLAVQFNYWYPVAGLVFALIIIPFAWNTLRLSLLFNYFRTEARRLEQQQKNEQFHFPEQLLVHSAQQLEKLLRLLGIESYRLEQNTELVSSLSERASGIEKTFPILIDGENYNLALSFSEYTEREQRQVGLLRRLLDAVSDSADDVTESSDIFSRQLNLIQNFQDYIDSSQHLFESSIQGLSSAVLVADLNGDVLFRNEQVSRFVQLKSRNMFELLQSCRLTGNDSWEQVIQATVLTSQAITVEAKSGDYDLSVSVRCLEDQSTRSPLLVLNMSDISQVKQAQRARNEMIDFISHDMRSPMASLQALVRQLQQSPESLSTEELLKKVEFHSQRGLNFAEEFLSLAKVESEESIQQYEVDMYSVSQNAIDTLYEQAEAKHIEIELQADDDCWVMGNGDMLERVILNLVSNAIKYSPSETRVEVVVKVSDDWIDLSVSDQGEGIDDQLLPNLFKSFQRGTGEREVKSKGLGLGLRFVDVALKRHDSQIEVRSGAQGTCFYFRLARLQF
ncbi:CHASE2 domain-containing protein [Bacterioplanoides sp.]|uniref:CHASE2 domain-containing protein n=1 Tax=Bacterioplanoides sp. TaxID=2066072 RepID=UPI003B5ADED8